MPLPSLRWSKLLKRFICITRKFNDISKPAVIVYALNGTNQRCQLPNVANGGGYDLSNSTSGRTDNNNGATLCVVSIDGPGV
jgi:hypothetical protein